MFPPIPSDLDEESQQQQQQQQQSFQLHSIKSTIIIRQLPSQGLSFQLWPAATTLVTLLDRHRSCHSSTTTTTTTTTNPLLSMFNRRHPRLRILELGSGTGVVGIAAAALLGATVTITDLPHVLPNMQFNVDANAGILDLCGGTVELAPLSWGENQDMEAIGSEYDIILGSDVVYHDHLYDPLIQTLKFFLLGNEKEVVFLMAHLKRWKKESAFFKKAKKSFDIEVIHTDGPSAGSRVGVTVYRFVKKMKN